MSFDKLTAVWPLLQSPPPPHMEEVLFNGSQMALDGLNATVKAHGVNSCVVSRWPL